MPVEYLVAYDILTNGSLEATTKSIPGLKSLELPDGLITAWGENAELKSGALLINSISPLTPSSAQDLIPSLRLFTNVTVLTSLARR